MAVANVTGRPFTTHETVCAETPTAVAPSLIVTRLWCMFSPLFCGTLTNAQLVYVNVNGYQCGVAAIWCQFTNRALESCSLPEFQTILIGEKGQPDQIILTNVRNLPNKYLTAQKCMIPC